MTKLTESATEDFAIKLLERLDNDYIPVPGGDNTLSKLMRGEVRVAC